MIALNTLKIEDFLRPCFEAARNGIVTCDPALTEFNDSLSAKDRFYAVTVVRRKLATEELSCLFDDMINHFARSVCSGDYSWNEFVNSLESELDSEIKIWDAVIVDLVMSGQETWSIRVLEFYNTLAIARKLIGDESFMHSWQKSFESLDSLVFINNLLCDDLGSLSIPVFGFDAHEKAFGSYKFSACAALVLCGTHVLEKKINSLNLKIAPGVTISKKVLISPVYVKKMGLRVVRLNYLNCSRILYPINVPQQMHNIIRAAFPEGGLFASFDDEGDELSSVVMHIPHSGASDISQLDNLFLKKVVGEYRRSSVYPQNGFLYAASRFDVDPSGFNENVGLIFEIMAFDLFLHTHSALSGDGSDIHTILISDKMINLAKHLFYCLSLTQLHELKKIIKKFPLLDEYIKSLAGSVSFADSDGSRKYLVLLREVLDLNVLPKLFEKIRYVMYPSEERITEMRNFCASRDVFVYYTPDVGTEGKQAKLSIGVLCDILENIEFNGISGNYLVVMRYSSGIVREQLSRIRAGDLDALKMDNGSSGPGIGIELVPIKSCTRTRAEGAHNMKVWMIATS